MPKLFIFSLPCRLLPHTPQFRLSSHLHNHPLSTHFSYLQTLQVKVCVSTIDNRHHLLSFEQCEHEISGTRNKTLIIVSFGSSLSGQDPINADWSTYSHFSLNCEHTTATEYAAEAYKCRLRLFWRRCRTGSRMSFDQPGWVDMSEKVPGGMLLTYYQIALRLTDKTRNRKRDTGRCKST